MSTYEEFMVILTAGILLVSILEFAIHKKYPNPGKLRNGYLN